MEERLASGETKGGDEGVVMLVGAVKGHLSTMLYVGGDKMGIPGRSKPTCRG